MRFAVARVRLLACSGATCFQPHPPRAIGMLHDSNLWFAVTTGHPRDCASLRSCSLHWPVYKSLYLGAGRPLHPFPHSVDRQRPSFAAKYCFPSAPRRCRSTLQVSLRHWRCSTSLTLTCASPSLRLDSRTTTSWTT